MESDLAQLRLVFRLVKQLDGSIDPTEIAEEVGERLREELDYAREARHMALYRAFLADRPHIAVPEPIFLLLLYRQLHLAKEARLTFSSSGRSYQLSGVGVWERKAP